MDVTATRLGRQQVQQQDLLARRDRPDSTFCQGPPSHTNTKDTLMDINGRSHNRRLVPSIWHPCLHVFIVGLIEVLIDKDRARCGTKTAILTERQSILNS